MGHLQTKILVVIELTQTAPFLQGLGLHGLNDTLITVDALTQLDW